MGANKVLVDTSGFYALWDAGDEHHENAVRVQTDLIRNKYRFVTTDYIVDETVTLLLMRHSHATACDFLQAVRESHSLAIEWMDSDKFDAAATLFSRHDDKQWSFTDCVSFVVMRQLTIEDCFTTDHHFRQAGFNPLL